MASYLFKTEPSTYSWSDLVREGRTTWDGITNAAALIAIRQMKAGDEAIIYHSGSDKAIVGIAKIVRGAYPDPKRDDPKLAVKAEEAAERLKLEYVYRRTGYGELADFMANKVA